MKNLCIHPQYDDIDEVVVGDGSGLVVSYIGSLTLKSPTWTFALRDTSPLKIMFLLSLAPFIFL